MLPLTGIISFIKLSGISNATPIDEKIFLTSSNSKSVTLLDLDNAVDPSFIKQGVFGITLTIFASPKISFKSSTVLPATILITSNSLLLNGILLKLLIICGLIAKSNFSTLSIKSFSSSATLIKLNLSNLVLSISYINISSLLYIEALIIPFKILPPIFPIPKIPSLYFFIFSPILIIFN